MEKNKNKIKNGPSKFWGPWHKPCVPINKSGMLCVG